MPIENGRWQGRVEQQLSDIDKRIDGLNTWLGAVDDRADDDRQQAAREIASLKVQARLGGFIGSLIGSLLVMIVVALVTKGFG